LSGEAPGTILSETDTTLRIVDMAGRAVEVPKDMDSCAFVYRVIARFLVSLEVGDRIVGAGKPEDFLVRIQPSLAATPSVGQGVVDLEALAQAAPDVFFHKAGDVKTLDAVEKLGIPAVGLRFETPEDMLTALDILGKVCGQREKAQALIDYYGDKTEAQAERIAGIPRESRKTAVMMGTTLGKVADGSMLQSTMIEAAGGINPAADVEATELWPTVGVEEIFAWDPDYIFITNSQDATYTAADLMADPAWSALEAVRSGHVYVMPCPADSWEFPGVVSLLGIDYMTMVMYPDLMDRADLEAAAKEFYTLSYGITLTLEDLGFVEN
jgi:iron complex transport system substrate-binding protein